jgi:NADH-quinone oxidoreductase subunit M
MLWLYQRTMFGELSNPKNQKLKDLSLREMVVFAPIVVLCFWIGLYPKPFIEPMEKSIEKVVRAVNPAVLSADRPAIAPRIEEATKRFEAARLERLARHGSGGEHEAPAGHGE